MDTYATVHAGDVLLGADGQEWGVLCVVHEPTFAVTLKRFEQEVTGYPPPDMEVTVLSRADTIEEARAYAALMESFSDVSLIGELWTA